MRSEYEHISADDSTSHRELQVLNEVEETPDLSQRELSRRVGVALGLTNFIIRDLTRRGYIRATRANWKRWIYTLTPDGISHKIRLTLSYVHRVLDDYEKVRLLLNNHLEELGLNQESRVAVLGTTEFASLVYLGLKEMGIEEIDFFSEQTQEKPRFLGTAVLEISVLNCDQYDRVILASAEHQSAGEAAVERAGADSTKLVSLFSDNGRSGY